MKAAVIGFTRKGSLLCRRLTELMRREGNTCFGYIPERYVSEMKETADYVTAFSSVQEFARENFYTVDAVIFIGAAGIAVRSIAPYLQDKLKDPAVLVIDDCAGHVISLLSGHMGGANELTCKIAGWLEADPVITTASDVNGKKAIDVWAKKQGLVVSDRERAKRVAQAVLDGKKVWIHAEEPFDRIYAEAIQTLIEDESAYTNCGPQEVRVKISIHNKKANDRDVLRLVPKALTLGIGCKKGVSAEAIEAFVEGVLKEYDLEKLALAAVASIDLKKEEPGLTAFAKCQKLPFLTFSSEELSGAVGKFQESAFVRQVTGIGNVCERAAVLAAQKQCGRPGRLLVPKTCGNGITAALAVMYERNV